MPITLKQILQGFIVLLLLIGFVWLAFYALIVVLVLSAFAVVFLYARRFLIAKGFISPKEEPIDGNEPVIDADYTDVTDKKEN